MCSCIAFNVVADDHSNQSALSIDQVMRMALKTHPLILSARGQFNAAESELSASKWSRFPTVSAGSQESKAEVKQNSTTVTLPVWLGGRISADIELAKSKRDSTLSGISEAQQTVMLESISQFFEYFKSEKKSLIADQNVDEHKRLFDIIQRRVAANTSPDVDTMLAQARLQSARSAQIQANSARAIAQSSLELLIGDAVSSVVVSYDQEPLDLTVDRAVSIGLAVSPKIARIKFDAEGLEADIKSAKSALYPQVSLSYEYGETEGGDFDGQISEEAFVSVQFQPGAGFSVGSAISAAKQRKQSAIDNLEAERRQLRRQIKTAWNEYTSVSLQLEPSKMLVDATSSVVESYLRQYAVGKKSWLDVLNAQRESTQARNTLVEYEILYLTSLYRLKVLLNEINPNALGA